MAVSLGMWPRQRAKRRRELAGSAGEQAFEAQLKLTGMTGWVREHRFAPPRLWRFDFAWPDRKVAVEIEGGAFSGGRHTRGTGFRADLDKYNAAALAGWLVLRVLPEQVKSGAVLTMVERVLA